MPTKNLDKFYTQPQVAEQCYNFLVKLYPQVANKKFLDYGGLNNNIDLDANIEYIDFNEEDFQENNINITNKENIDEIDKNEEEYLKNPIIQNALELGFDLVEAINALKICVENQDIVINYLYDSQNQKIFLYKYK